MDSMCSIFGWDASIRCMVESGANAMTEAAKAWEQRLHQAGAKVEEDIRRLVTYLNEEVVPDVRRYGSSALRTAAIELHRLAEQMDDSTQGSTSPYGHPQDRTKP